MKFQLILLILILCSCVSTKKLEKLGPNEESYSDFENLIYSNCPNYLDNSCDYRFNLVDQLRLEVFSKDTLPNWNHLLVEIRKNKKSLSINVIDGDRLVENFELKGKWKNDSFYVRRFIRPIGIPLLFFIYYEKKLILKFLEDELLVINGRFEAIIVLFISGGIDPYSSMKYERTSCFSTE
ncbi:hypothetical protein [Brumimicrobium mesophilum]|uniref:hypothetical protein n=1 Tax=Brumimicrobium mesophilum TaxID=392717 RepID=UPI000D13FCD6|nr:hypothetical protein [Brumimicrobium mesophilum]